MASKDSNKEALLWPPDGSEAKMKRMGEESLGKR